jgi:hypothetical protein
MDGRLYMAYRSADSDDIRYNVFDGAKRLRRRRGAGPGGAGRERCVITRTGYIAARRWSTCSSVRERRLASFGALRLDVRRGACEGVECGCPCLLALPGREFGRLE